jgi:hypothetical protein
MHKRGILAIGLLGVTSWLAMPVAHAATTNEHADLVGADEGGSGGDPDGKGSATIVLDDVANTVCYQLTYQNIGKPTAAHIHTGAKGVSGPPAVDLDIAKNGDKGCVAANPTDVAAIRDNPDGHYVNIHTAEFPKGAIRGQLIKG